MTYENILFEQSDGVAIITLNRPKVLNALSTPLTLELDAAVGKCEADDDVKAIIITGAGEKAFSAGADIHEMAELPPEALEQRGQQRGEATWHMAVCRKPVIGALNGLAYGGGAMLASTFDIRLGCERSRFRFLAATYGRINSTWTLPTIVGMPMAKELLYTGRVVEDRRRKRLAYSTGSYRQANCCRRLSTWPRRSRRTRQLWCRGSKSYSTRGSVVRGRNGWRWSAPCSPVASNPHIRGKGSEISWIVKGENAEAMAVPAHRIV
jgi:hypothetical protein